MINCEIELDLTWSEAFLISQILRTTAVATNPNAKNAKLYVPVVTLSINNNIKFLESIKQGFKRTVSWNKYRSEVATQPKNNNLEYMIDPKFGIINRLFVNSFKLGRNLVKRNNFNRYYLSLAEIKDFNLLIDNKQFFNQSVENKKEAFENLVEISRKNDYVTGNLLDYLHHQKYYKLVVIDLSRQKIQVFLNK